MFIQAVDKILSLIAHVPFDAFVWIVWGSYVAIFLAALLATLLSVRAKNAEKKPFLALTNAYSGVNLAVFLLKAELAPSLLVTVIFWVTGYILYGVLCFFSVKKKREKQASVKAVLPVETIFSQPVHHIKEQAPAAKSNVKLEHAVNVTENLLAKNLAKSDRQELEKLKNTLAVLQIKGTLTPTETEILNDNFNALLKLMAKYNA